MKQRKLTWTSLTHSIVLLLVLCVLVESARAGEASGDPSAKTGFVNRVFKDDQGDHKYVVFVPRQYSPDRAWPVILFLHGAGERGSDGVAQTKVGLGPAIEARAKSFPFIAVFPQCEDTKGRILTAWSAESSDGQRALAILDAVEKEFNIDKKHQVLTGWSMGGYGAFSLGAAQSNRWAAIVPVSGGAEPKLAKALASVPVWIFHGADDAIVRPDESRKIATALRQADANVRYDELSGVGHDIWRDVYDNDALYAWMLNPAAVTASKVALRVKPGQKRLSEPSEDTPFVPAVEMTNAAYVRLGNEMLDALSVAVPDMVPPDMLAGQLNDMYDYTVAEGRSFQITFAGVSYQAELSQVRLEAYAKDRLNVQLGLENVAITIGTTYLSGSSHSAVAGPISIVIGHQRPVWLSFDVTPYVDNGTLRLKFVAASFEIPYDNWYVTSPAGISVSGLGMTREKVRRGLVDGLYGSKARIENEFVAIVPNLVKTLEEKLTMIDQAELVSTFWPLPVYRPRVRLWPQAVSTDKQGISVVLGVTAAAVDAQSAPKTPQRIDNIGLSVDQVPRITGLQAAIAPDILRPLTKLLIDADVARIHVQDIPEKAFEPLGDPATLAKAIPDLKQYGDQVEVWSELILVDPLQVTDAPPATAKAKSDQKDEKAAAERSDRLEFVLPKLLLSLAIRGGKAGKDWMPYAELEIRMAQQGTVEVVRETRQKRALRLGWSGDPEIHVTGRFAPEYAPKSSKIDTAQFTQLLADGWRGWTSIGPASQTDVPDLEFGSTRLRLSDAGWSKPNLYLDFAAPGVSITNNSSVAVEYEIKAPNTGWGGPYKLEPKKTHEFDVTYPLTYRRKTASGVNEYTLAPGSYLEFKSDSKDAPPRLYQMDDALPEETAAESVDAAEDSSAAAAAASSKEKESTDKSSK